MLSLLWAHWTTTGLRVFRILQLEHFLAAFEVLDDVFAECKLYLLTLTLTLTLTPSHTPPTCC